jgi:hypothetical protein
MTDIVNWRDNIEAWLDTCLGNHKGCAKTGPFVPPRFLQVDTAGNFRMVLKTISNLELDTLHSLTVMLSTIATVS